MNLINYYSGKYQYVIYMAMAMAVAGGTILFQQLATPDVQSDGVLGEQDAVAMVPQVLADFNLTDQNGQTFSLEQLKGKWTFMFFGYMRCPDVCPTSLTVMQNIASTLERDPRQIKSQFVFVSIDPQRDKLDDLGGFVEYFNSSFIGITGKPLQLQRLTQQLGVEASRIKGDDARNYLMSHTSAIMLIDPLARLQARYLSPHERASILKQFYISRYQFKDEN